MIRISMWILNIDAGGPEELKIYFVCTNHVLFFPTYLSIFQSGAVVLRDYIIFTQIMKLLNKCQLFQALPPVF